MGLLSLKTGNIVLRAFQFIWAILTMALIGNIIAMARGHSAAVVNYCLFTVAFTLLTLFYLVPASFSDKVMMHPMILFIVDLLNTIFIFCAAIALPSKLHAPDCSNNTTTWYNPVTWSSSSREKACRNAQASTAFLWFLWFTFLISTILSGILLVKTLKGPSEKRKSSRTPAPQPSMSQV